MRGSQGRELVARLPRRPGQKETRYTQLLGDGDAESVPVESTPREGLAARVTALEERVERLEEALPPTRSQPL